MKKHVQFTFCLLSILLVAGISSAQKPKKGNLTEIISIAGVPSMAKININNLSTYFYNNGQSDQTPIGDNGFKYPKGSGRTVFYQTGPVWGGSIDGFWALGGSMHSSGLQPGRILPDGSAEALNSASVRIYRVRSDYRNYINDEDKKRLFAEEIADEGKTAGEIFAQYDLDWNQWPAQYGAPFIDKDKNGVYDPAKDIPGMSENPCQTIWFAANDLDPTVTAKLYKTLPMKIEMQATIWAVKASGAQDNTIYRRYKLINRNNKKIDSMYISMWCDPDLGGSFDDFCGSDSANDLGYVYNGRSYDEVYGSYPPAAGFQLLETPYVKGTGSDAARYDLKLLPGFKNLGMTSFYVHSNGVTDDWSDPQYQNYAGCLKMKNWFEGKLGVTGTPWVDPTTGKTTKYLYSGDPVAGTGWNESRVNDRRFGLASGPFTMNPNDTQQVVAAQIVSGGKEQLTNLEAVTALKYYARSITFLWNNGFQISLPKEPELKISEFNNGLILNWWESSSVEKCEKNLSSIYKFQGYNVYQFPSAASTLSQGVRLITYDITDELTSINELVEDPVTGKILKKAIGFGNNSGIKRFYKVEQDALGSNKPLNNFSKYYFGVTAYYVASDPNAVPRLIESPVKIVTAIPQMESPGERVQTEIGDLLDVAHTSGESEGEISVTVVNPKEGDGNEYSIRFPSDTTYTVYRGATPVFTNMPVKGISTDNPIAAGAQINVGYTPKFAIKNVKINKGKNPWSTTTSGWPMIYTDSNYLWKGGLQIGKRWFFNGYQSGEDGSSLTSREKYHKVILKFASTDANGVFNENDPNASVGYRYMANAHSDPAKAEFVPFIKNKLHYGFQEFGLAGKANIPIAAYDLQTGKRLALGFLENNDANGLVDGRYYPRKSDAGSSLNPAETLFILGDEYSVTANQGYMQSDRELLYNNKYGALPIMYFISAPRDYDQFSADDEVAIEVYKLYKTNDEYRFNIPSTLKNVNLAKEDVDKINVFPNPYYGRNSLEGSAFQRFVTFTHLPQRANITIFNLSGQIVRKMEKDGSSQIMTWNLMTDHNVRIPSGIFVARIEMPDLCKVKILKFAVIIDQQYRVRY